MQTYFTRNYACLLCTFALLTAGLLYSTASARTFHTLADGNYENRTIWDLGTTPGANDTIFIHHDLVTSSGIGFGPRCVLTVVGGGTFRINGSMLNQGEIHIFGSVDVAGNATNEGEITIAFGRKLEVSGNFTNNNLITNDGIVIVMGTMENTATADGNGHYDVCGITTNNGHAEPTLTLCQICGEKYFNLGTGTYTEVCGSLPVELSNFTASAGKGQVDLSWTTLSESNSAHFVLQRALAGNAYRDLKVVDAAGESSAPINYAAVDDHPLAGEISYRLKMVDRNGESTFSETVTVQYTPVEAPSITVFPNPSTGNISYTLQEIPVAELKVLILDLSGAVIRQDQVNTHSGTMHAVDLTQLPRGYYLLQARYPGGQVSQKILLF